MLTLFWCRKAEHPIVIDCITRRNKKIKKTINIIAMIELRISKIGTKFHNASPSYRYTLLSDIYFITILRKYSQ